ncbi:MAG TPA: PadR family transcriptional regulator [Sphingomicrobium sp.]|jgi:DNA-binding PadR family transcriptional regulator|nr:PadR family transcriptional regulator [Sphingomicrobium sp.]
MSGQSPSNASRANAPALSEHEGMLLALIIRQQPATAYKLLKIFENSPVTSINASKGQLYPAIRRLKERKLIAARKVRGDGRNVEELEVTRLGQAAVREWVMDVSENHVVLDDPLRTRILSLDLLSREERLEWAARAKELVKKRGEAIEAYNRSVSVPYQAFVHRGAMEMVDSKAEWLDELLYHIARGD